MPPLPSQIALRWSTARTCFGETNRPTNDHTVRVPGVAVRLEGSVCLDRELERARRSARSARPGHAGALACRGDLESNDFRQRGGPARVQRALVDAAFVGVRGQRSRPRALTTTTAAIATIGGLREHGSSSVGCSGHRSARAGRGSVEARHRTVDEPIAPVPGARAARGRARDGARSRSERRKSGRCSSHLLLNGTSASSVDRLVEALWAGRASLLGREARPALRFASPEASSGERRSRRCPRGYRMQVSPSPSTACASNSCSPGRSRCPAATRSSRRDLTRALALWRGRRSSTSPTTSSQQPRPPGSTSSPRLFRSPAALRSRSANTTTRLPRRPGSAPNTLTASGYVALHMLALYRAGRQVEALEVFRQAATASSTSWGSSQATTSEQSSWRSSAKTLRLPPPAARERRCACPRRDRR